MINNIGQHSNASHDAIRFLFTPSVIHGVLNHWNVIKQSQVGSRLWHFGGEDCEALSQVIVASIKLNSWHQFCCVTESSDYLQKNETWLICVTCRTFKNDSAISSMSNPQVWLTIIYSAASFTLLIFVSFSSSRLNYHYFCYHYQLQMIRRLKTITCTFAPTINSSREAKKEILFHRLLHEIKRNEEVIRCRQETT